MKTRTKIVLFLVLAVLGIGFFFSTQIGPSLVQQGLNSGSDASQLKGKITVAGDNYFGYWFLTSPVFIQNLRNRGYATSFVNDGGNYPDRNKKFSEGAYDMMVLPINSYLYHGQAFQYPGVIPVALSESKGADSIVAHKGKITGGEDRAPTVNDLNDPNLKICVTPDSPSSFLLDIAVAHFALDKLASSSSWRVDADGSQDAYNKFVARQCDVAILWEPDVSKALSDPDVVTVFGSDQVSEMIIDVFVVRRALLSSNPDLVASFFQAYFETLTYYQNHRDEMIQTMAKNSAFKSTDAVNKALGRIAWYDGSSNCRDWFAIGQQATPAATKEKIVDALTLITNLMVEVKDLKTDPLGGNPYKIINSSVLASVCPKINTQVAPTQIGVIVPAAFSFTALSDAEWAQLKVVGSMRVLPITFDTSTANVTTDSTSVMTQVNEALTRNYPQYRVLVRGHTGPSGDETANVALSRQRADAVKNNLVQTYHLDANRLHAVGIGSKEPLERQPGETERAYRDRLARVEFVLVEDKK